MVLLVKKRPECVSLKVEIRELIEEMASLEKQIKRAVEDNRMEEVSRLVEEKKKLRELP